MWEKRKEDLPAKPAPARDAGNGSGSRTMAPGTPPRHIAQPAGGTARIGKAVAIKGKIYSEEDLYIDGEVEGTLEMSRHKLTIGPHGKAVAKVSAREVIVQGTIDGDVDAVEKVAICSEGSVVGDIQTAGIIIDDGAVFKGRIDIVRSEDRPAGNPVPKPSYPELSGKEPHSQVSG